MRTRRLLAVAAACLLTLCACSPFKEKTDISDLPILQLIHEDFPSEDSPWRVNIYRYDDDAGLLISETKEIEVGSWEDRAHLLFETFLSQGTDVGLGKTGVRLSFVDIEITNNIANVYFSSSTLLSDRQRLIITAAAANTAVENLEVDYANVFIDNCPMSIQGLPCGLFLKSDSDILGQYETLKLKYFIDGSPVTTLAVDLPLYFISSEGEMALPEVRNITVRGDLNSVGIAAELIYQLYIGSEADDDSNSPIREDFSPQLAVDDENGEAMHHSILLDLSFEDQTLILQNADLFLEDPGRVDSSLVSIYYTFCAVFQNVKQIRFVFDENTYSVSRENAEEYLGCKITLYVPREDLNMLVEYDRVTTAGEALRAEARVEALLELYSSSGAGEGYHSFPAGLSEDCLLSLKIVGEYAILDFKADFYRYVNSLYLEEQRGIIYSLINTLCIGIERVRAVQFCVDGEYAGIVGENLNLFAPLLPDMGIVG